LVRETTPYLSTLTGFFQRDCSGGGFANCFLEERSFTATLQDSLQVEGRGAFLNGDFHLVVND